MLGWWERVCRILPAFTQSGWGRKASQFSACIQAVNWISKIKINVFSWLQHQAFSIVRIWKRTSLKKNHRGNSTLWTWCVVLFVLPLYMYIKRHLFKIHYDVWACSVAFLFFKQVTLDKTGWKWPLSFLLIAGIMENCSGSLDQKGLSDKVYH